MANTQADDLKSIEAQVAEGRYEEAKTQIDRLLERQPENAAAWYVKGIIHRYLNDAGTAAASFNQALKAQPDFVDACLQLADTLDRVGKIELAIKTYEHWLKILQAKSRKKVVTASPDALQRMKEQVRQGNACLERHAIDEAIAAYGKALSIDPDFTPALTNMGTALYHLRRFDEAEQMLFHTLRVKPGDPDALNTLGTCYKEQGRLAQSIALYRQAVASQPDYLFGWLNLGKCYADLKAWPAAIDAYERTLALSPGHTEALGELLRVLYNACQWDKLEPVRTALEQALTNGDYAEPFTIMSHLPGFQRENAMRWAHARYQHMQPYDAARPLPADARKDGKLRVGYLSSDLQRHATAALITEMFEQHDRSRFAIYAYSHAPDDGGEERRRILRAVDVFRDVLTMDDTAVDALIRDDGIDILVDLKGYTQDNRLSIMTHRPAPMAMHYLGYPGTLGMACIDYYIGDGMADAAEFSEALIQLPHSYQINDRKRPLPNPRPKADYGLPPEGLVFCNFNNVNKITPPLFALWMRLLKAVEGSLLWLFATHPVAIANLRREADAQGVDPKRLIFAGAAKMSDHLGRYAHADLCLDTQPYSGHTTTSDALWCGVPVVTTTGEGFASRVAAGLVQAVQLPELVTQNLEQYEKLALELARDANKRQAIKDHLNKGRMQFPLFDSAATTRAIEAAYQQAADLHRQGKSPKSFSITPDLQPV